jgi:SET domain-containing protein
MIKEAGIGVFSLSRIPAGKSLGLFLKDYSDDSVDYRDVPDDLLAYCLNIGDGKVRCPRDFTQMSIANYINHNENNNVRYDLDLGFVALRDIEENEEIFADYAEIGDLHGVSPENRESYVG